MGSLLHGALLGALLLVLAAVLRVWLVLVPKRLKISISEYRAGADASKSPQKSAQDKPATVRTMVVLGSGGHTTEMLKLMKQLKRDVYTPFTFVVAETDKTSKDKVTLDWQPSAADQFVFIPRSREVSTDVLIALLG